MSAQHPRRRRKVLIAMDRSKHSHDAFKLYMQHIYKEDDVTILAHVPESSRLVPIIYMQHIYNEGDVAILVHVPESSLQNPITFITSDSKTASRIGSEEERNTKLFLGRLREMASHSHIEARIIRLTGQNPGESIVQAASTHDVDLIVTGSRRLGKFRRAMLGSVSDYIVHHSPVPVFVC